MQCLSCLAQYQYMAEEIRDWPVTVRQCKRRFERRHSSCRYVYDSMPDEHHTCTQDLYSPPQYCQYTQTRRTCTHHLSTASTHTHARRTCTHHLSTASTHTRAHAGLVLTTSVLPVHTHVRTQDLYSPPQYCQYTHTCARRTCTHHLSTASTHTHMHAGLVLTTSGLVLTTSVLPVHTHIHAGLVLTTSVLPVHTHMHAGLVLTTSVLPVHTQLTPTNIHNSLQPPVLWHRWLSVRKRIWSVKIEWLGFSVVICLEQGVDCLHMVQLMSLSSPNPRHKDKHWHLNIILMVYYYR